MFPRPLGIALVVGGATYLVDMLTRFPFPEVGERIHGILAIPPTIAEVWMVGYLLVRGVKSPRLPERTPAPAEHAPAPA